MPRVLREVSLLDSHHEGQWSRWRTFNGPTAKGPRSPGIYEFSVVIKGRRVVLYVGAANDLNKRHSQYLKDGSHIRHKFDEARKLGCSVQMRYIAMTSAGRAFVLERRYLETFDYAWNTQCNGRARATEEAILNSRLVRPHAYKQVPLQNLSKTLVERIKKNPQRDSKKPKQNKKKRR